MHKVLAALAVLMLVFGGALWAATLDSLELGQSTIEAGPYRTQLAGNGVDEFTLPLGGVTAAEGADGYRYVGVRAATTTDLDNGDHPFFITSYPGQAFLNYWAAKGVDDEAAAGSWQAKMWEIISGNEPIFYLKKADDAYSLIDGLQRAIGQGDQPFRVNNDYPVGDYTLTGETANPGTVLATIDITITHDGPVTNVTQNLKYCTIQDAINAATADNTIDVAAGTYNENVTIDKAGLTLRTNPGAVLEGDGAGNGILVTAKDATIDGFEIINYAIGVRTFGGPSDYGDLIIQNCHIHANTQNGILITHDIFDSVSVLNCQVDNNVQNGIGIANGSVIDELLINPSTVSGNGHHGLYIAGAGTTIHKMTVNDTDMIANGHSAVTIDSGSTVSDATFDDCSLDQSDVNFTVRGATTVVNSLTILSSSISGSPTNHGFWLREATINGLLFDNVTIENNKHEGFRVSNGATLNDGKILGGEIRGNAWGLLTLDVATTVNTLQVLGVEIKNHTAGSGVSAASGTVNDLTIGSCTFEGNAWEHLDVGVAWIGVVTVSNVLIVGNTFGPGTGNSVWIAGNAVFGADDVNIHLNNFVSGVPGVFNNTAVQVDATQNWWGMDSGPTHAGNPGGTGDAVSDNVLYDPWIPTAAEETTTETVTGGGTVTTPGGVAEAVVTGAATVTVAEYEGNPTGSGFGTNEAGYIDVYVPDVTGVTEIEVRLYYPAGADTTTLKLFWWDGAAWVECSNQGVNTAQGYLWATITATSVPTLSDLTGTIFGAGAPFPASTFWFEDFEYANQAAMETAGWDFLDNAENLWHLAPQSTVPSSAYAGLVPFPSPSNAAWFGDPATGTYAKTAAPKSLSTAARAQQTRMRPMGAGQGYPYGELTSPAIDVAGQNAVSISFSYFREVECYIQGSYDQTYVQVSFDDGPWETVWAQDSTTCSGMRAWLDAGNPSFGVAVPAGTVNMRIRFVFNAVDTTANNYLGWLIDDLGVASAGPGGLRFQEQNLGEGLAGEAYTATIHALGGTAAEGYTWRVLSKPDWLTPTFDPDRPDRVVFIGTPPAGAPTTTYALCLGVSDDRGQTYERCYDIIIEQFVAGGDLFFDDFETIKAWTTIGLWQRVQNVSCVSPAYASPTHVYYYGRTATCNYVAAGRTTGTLLSPVIGVEEVTAGSALTIGWKYWRQTEAFANGAFDQTFVEYMFDTQAQWTQIWYDDSKQVHPQQGWHLVEIAGIAKPAGAVSLQVRFTFDSVDGYANNFIGWLIDDVKVIQQVTGADPLAITTVCDDLPDGEEGTAYTAQLNATGGTEPYAWSWNTAIPGLALNATTGAITGTPTEAADFARTFGVQDGAGSTKDIDCTITIDAAPDCPCDLANINFSNGLVGQLGGTWTVDGLWHVTDNGCAAGCAVLDDDYAYYGLDATCNYNTGARTAGHLTSAEVAVDACIENIAILFDHFRGVEAYFKGSFDRTFVQVRWNTGAWGAWTTVWQRDSKHPSPDCEAIAIGPINVPAGATQVQVRFGFDSIDNKFNLFIGWGVDNIWIKDHACVAGPLVAPASFVSPIAAGRDEIMVLNVPNPVRDVNTTVFSVRGLEVEAMRIQIFDLNQILVFEEEIAGDQLVWHTINNYGQYLANGIYIYRAIVKQGGVWITTGFQKLVILR